MVEMKRYHCEECGYYWEVSSKEKFPESCPGCKSQKVHQAAGNRRFSRKARPKVRWSFPSGMRR
ncbi:hypothetical protein BMS3Abin03_00535 [bacterium BMS3Abin03]|nr:hypothetical protein BMS3Abin03_00535 [bacterium BMS3Abin03]